MAVLKDAGDAGKGDFRGGRGGGGGGKGNWSGREPMAGVDG